MIPSKGRIVIFTANDGEERPAIVTKVWNVNCVDLQVFGDIVASGMSSPIVASVYYSTNPGEWGWRWPEKV